MKRIILVILTIALLVCSFSFAGCIQKPQPQELTELTIPQLANDQMVVVIKQAENKYICYVVTLNKHNCGATTLEGVLEYLSQNGLNVVFDNGVYGKFVKEIGTLKQEESQSKYVMFYTNLPQNSQPDTPPAYVVGDVNLNWCKYGVSQTQVQSGAVVYFETSNY